MLIEEFESLFSRLREAATELSLKKHWPSQQLDWLNEFGVFKCFIPSEFGGAELSPDAILELYLELGQACMTTTFVLTQWNAACKRIQASTNEPLKRELLPKLASGSLFATVGISHLTTSRQHISKPVLSAETRDDGFVLNGISPWVTGAMYADIIVVGAITEDGQQILVALDRDSPGVEAHSGADLIALSSSCTDQIKLNQVFVPRERVVAGPASDVLKSKTGGGAGGLQTSTLAIGLAWAAAKYLQQEAVRRPELELIATKLCKDCEDLQRKLFDLANGKAEAISAADLRQHANSLVLRSSQAALSAAKGAGFMATHPAGRWAREAMFFLVWSCPQPVVTANMCELAQI